MARSVWALVQEVITDTIDNIQAWLETVFKSISHAETTIVVVTLWALWLARRKIIHEGQFQSQLSTHLFVVTFIADLQLLQPA